MNDVSLKQASSEEFTKGYLYKIKNSLGKTQGYLFGTIHKLDSERHLKLHPKIFKYLEKCGALFLEINPLDSSLLINPLDSSLSDEIKKHSSLVQLTEGEINEIIEKIKSEILVHPEAVEHILTSHAIKTNMEIKGLETIESRLRAKIDTRSDRESLEIKALAISAFAIKYASDKLTAVTNSNDKELQLIEAYEALVDAIKRMDFKLRSDYAEQRLEMKSALNKLIDVYDVIFKSVYEEKGKNLIAAIRILYATLEQFDQGNSPIFEQWLKKNQEAYSKGDKDFRSEYPNKGNLLDKKIKEVDLKELFLRDNFMLESIQKKLSESNEKSRNFYAVGSAHLLDDYENLRIKLEKKDWKIVDAYK
jgi:uncharacterized protein YbaP (TraB family)